MRKLYVQALRAAEMSHDFARSRKGPKAPVGSGTPAAGLSIVDELPDTLEKVTLGPNPALIDGDTSASASLDIGYAPALAGDSRPREAGIQLSAATEVNLLRAWTDRPLPPAVFAGYGWSVLRSDDNNLSWTPVPLISAVLGGASSFADVQVASTSARYLKVVTRPLPASVTSDARHAESS